MAKMTIASLKTAMKTYVAAAKQAGTWNATTENFVGCLDKIGKMVTIDGEYNDKLPELDGEELPLGKTIEEYFIDLTLPEAYSSIAGEGAKDVVPALPTVEQVAYSYSLGREKIKTTVPYDNFERACLTAEDSANMGAKIMERLQNSYTLTRYAEKKQLLGNAIDKAVTANLVTEIAVPADTETSEKFIEAIKVAAEDAKFAHEGGIGGALIGAAPELILFVKKGVMPVVQVQALAGAFQKDELALPAKVVVVEDFGELTNDTVFALLADPRGIKLHNGYNAIRSSGNADGDFVNFVKHFEDTGFISKYCYMQVFKPIK